MYLKRLWGVLHIYKPIFKKLVRSLSILTFVLSLGLIPGLFLSSNAGAANFAADSLIIPMDVTYQNYGMWKA